MRQRLLDQAVRGRKNPHHQNQNQLYSLRSDSSKRLQYTWSSNRGDYNNSSTAVAPTQTRTNHNRHKLKKPYRGSATMENSY